MFKRGRNYYKKNWATELEKPVKVIQISVMSASIPAIKIYCAVYEFGNIYQKKAFPSAAHATDQIKYA